MLNNTMTEWTPYYSSDPRVKGPILTVEKDYDAGNYVTTLLIKANHDPYILAHICEELKKYGYNSEIVAELEDKRIYTRNHTNQCVKCSFDDVAYMYDKNGKRTPINRVTPKWIIQECLDDHQHDIVMRFLMDCLLLSCQDITISRELLDGGDITTKVYLESGSSIRLAVNKIGTKPDPNAIIEVLANFIYDLGVRRTMVQDDPETLFDIDCEIGSLSALLKAFKKADWPNLILD